MTAAPDTLTGVLTMLTNRYLCTHRHLPTGKPVEAIERPEGATVRVLFPFDGSGPKVVQKADLVVIDPTVVDLSCYFSLAALEGSK